MTKVSVIIPSRNERFLVPTVKDLLKNGGDIEVIAVLDGYWEYDLPDDKRLRVVHRGRAMGMRASINAAAAIAQGEYLMKCDGHCSFQEGFDEVLSADCEDNWIVIPRRDRLDAENWTRQETGKPVIDYHYLSCPITNREGYSMHGAIWNKRTLERLDKTEYEIDETMSFQGSSWFMSKKHWNWLGGMSEVGYGTFTQEPQEIGMKTWLGGGKIMVNKRTTYLHLHKGKKYGRGYSMNRKEVKDGHLYSARYWMGNQWQDRVHDIEWLIDRFSPVPTWDADWQERRFEYVKIDR